MKSHAKLGGLLAAAFLLLLGSCRSTPSTSGGTDTTGNNTGLTSAIDGSVLRGPISPVSRPGVPNDAPLAGATISIAQTNAAANPTNVVSDTAGKFYLKVSPGTYMLTPNGFPNSVWPRPQAPVTIQVPANTIVKDTLNYDTGIR